ncbi:MAG: thiamine phosphate synthase [Brevinema sp.]
MVPFYRFMLITQKKNTPISKYLTFIKQCADGGITSLQLREKNLDPHELLELGMLLKNILDPYKIPLVVNDNPQLAAELDSQYVHLGQKDHSIEEASKIYPSAQLGISIESLDNVFHANKFDNIAYVTASAVFHSQNKTNLEIYWGLNGLKEIEPITKHPLTAIGGIDLENVGDVIDHGAQGVAVIGALHDADDPYQTTLKMRKIIDSRLS